MSPNHSLSFNTGWCYGVTCFAMLFNLTPIIVQLYPDEVAMKEADNFVIIPSISLNLELISSCSLQCIFLYQQLNEVCLLLLSDY